MIFVGRAARLFPGLNLRTPRIPVTIQTRFFFDRAAVKNALSNMEYAALTKASMLVRDTAVKSIKKVGNARPQLKIMKDNPNVSMSVLVNTPGISKSTVRGLKLRMAEIKFPPASPPGTPPFTHVPSSKKNRHMLGFRVNLYNAFDPVTKTAVVGPTKKGADWGIPNLHEFGGKKTLVEYVWRPKYPRYKTILTKWATPLEPLDGQWTPTGRTKSANYPARPYMLPAMVKCLPKMAKMFEGKFSARRLSS